MGTCRVSVRHSPSYCGGRGHGGGHQEATAWSGVGRPGRTGLWAWACGPGCVAEGGGPLAVAPQLTRAHARSCGVLSKADAAPC